MSEQVSHHIGMFDSGIGGLTVMKALMAVLPQESIVYFGDTARVPYGEKSPETIIRYSLENSTFLFQKKIKVLVVACNTATACAIDELRKAFDVPIVGVIEPGAKKAVEVTRNQRIAVLGTKRTIKSGVYEREIKKLCPQAQVISIACPLFVPLVEEEFTHHPAARLIVQEYLKPLKEHNIDTILLGCTHYPLLHDLIQQEVGPQVTIIDSAQSCAESVAELLKEKQLVKEGHALPEHRYYVSDDPDFFQKKSRGFLGDAIVKVSMK